MSDETRKKVYSVNDVAAMCHVSNETIRRWVRKQGLKAYNTAAGLAIKIVGKDLEEFAEKYNIYVDWD
ncbi:MAG: helix-turn-helix domain-containing protein [Deltaproteobacteria bacterium]|nr:helix-turn-helix domain-containing protein [Deltaproteobacteria bacterium]